MRVDLKEEGICESPHEIIHMITSRTPFNSYKKDNSDLKPEDRPYISLVMKDGRYVTLQLWVVDKLGGLLSYRRQHANDTRYILPSQTPNYKRKEAKNDYQQVEIRIDKLAFTNLKEVMAKN